jgi:hypothetical protein
LIGRLIFWFFVGRYAVRFRTLISTLKRPASNSTPQSCLRVDNRDGPVNQVCDHRLTLDILPRVIPLPLSRSSCRVSLLRWSINAARSSLLTDLLPIEYDDAPPVSKALIAASTCANNVAVCDML